MSKFKIGSSQTLNQTVNGAHKLLQYCIRWDQTENILFYS